MPTCSQAKIISNLEFDINKRVYNITNRDQEITSISRLENPVKTYRDYPLRNHDQYQNRECQNCVQPHNKLAANSRRTLVKQLNQFSHDEIHGVSSYNLKANKKLPAINNVFIARRDSVPINFLYNSNFRNKSGGQSRLSPTKVVRKPTPVTDHEDNEANSDANSSWLSSGSDNYVTEQHQQQQQTEPVKRYTSNIYSHLPKLAFEIEHIDDTSSDHTNSNEDEAQFTEKRRFSITGAKRLLALASIRPSKTFHKELTIEEAEILKKYYDIIKPKVQITVSQLENDEFSAEKAKIIEIPILYDSAKINYDTFSCLEMFLTEYKSEITSGKFNIEYNLPGYHGFILKNSETDTIVQFPAHVHDTFVALAISINAHGNSTLDENHILKSINWNDTRHILAPKPTKRKNSKTNNDTFKKNIPSVSIDAIKELSRIVRTIVEPKLLKKVSNNGIDMR
jgi:hypothetical protein